MEPANRNTFNPLSSPKSSTHSINDRTQISEVGLKTLCSLSDQTLNQLYTRNELVIYQKTIYELPPCIGDLTHITSLTISCTDLQFLPDTIGRLIHLSYLNLNKNRLDKVPPTIDKLSRLRELDLSQNRLTEIPESIGTLSQLETLWLGCNEISAIPSSIGHLKKLSALILVGNKLHSLPTTIGTLSSLRVLLLTKNHFTSIPRLLFQLDKGCQVHLTDNPIPLDRIKTHQSVEKHPSYSGPRLIFLSDDFSPLEDELSDTEKLNIFIDYLVIPHLTDEKSFSTDEYEKFSGLEKFEHYLSWHFSKLNSAKAGQVLTESLHELIGSFSEKQIKINLMEILIKHSTKFLEKFEKKRTSCLEEVD